MPGSAASALGATPGAGDRFAPDAAPSAPPGQAGPVRRADLATRAKDSGTPTANRWSSSPETLRIDETAFTAELGGRSLDLTYREFALLKFFAMHPERVFTRDDILLAVWGDDYFGGTRTVDVHVRRLRAKLGKDLENAIHTVRNVGYRFSADSVTDTDGDSEAET
jgi:DNA-binding response OmpR family regulator